MAAEKTVLITGSSRGIGRAAAIAFARDGFNVIINYNQSFKSAIELNEYLHSLNYSSIIIKADISNRSEVDSMFKQALDLYGSIDVLVNNAGIAQQKLFTDISEPEWDRMFNINIKGIYNCCQAVIPCMVHRKSGKIINISSMWGISGSSCEVHYSASKAAVIGFTKALAKELGPSGINVNCIAPGVIATDMNSNIDEISLNSLREETPLERLGSPDDVANMILFLASDKADFITGQVISVDGGFIL